MLDARSYRILEALAALRGAGEDVYNGYFLPITIAKHLNEPVELVCDEFDILARAGFVQLKPYPGNDRMATLAILSPSGDAELSSRRKIAAAGAKTGDKQVPPQHYEIFLSHASDDNDYALPLYEALSRQFSVFIDKARLRAGADFPFDLGAAIAGSDFGVFLITPAFMAKGYTREEFGAFFHRAVERGRPTSVIPIIRSTTFGEVAAFNEFLARRLQLNADTQPLSEIVREISLVVRPPAISLQHDAERVGASRAHRSGPEDALPEQPHLLPFLPRIEFANTAVRQDGTRLDLSFELRSIGPGDCFNVAYFLPLLDEGRAADRISKEAPFRRTVRLDQTRAYRQYAKGYFKAVFEFEDVAGNLYRQYGDVHQIGDNPFPNYWIDNMTRPCLVARRLLAR